MKLRIEVISCAGYAVQTEEFELNADALDVITTVNTMVTGQIKVTAITETPVVGQNLSAGLIPRENR